MSSAALLEYLLSAFLLRLAFAHVFNPVFKTNLLLLFRLPLEMAIRFTSVVFLQS